MIYKLAAAFKKFEGFVLQVYLSFVSLFKILVLSRFGVKIPLATEEECFILGNGPSLKESIQKYDALFTQSRILCVNHFALTEEYQRYKPEYYVLLDPLFFSGDAKERDPNVNRTYHKLLHETSWPMNLFVPQLSKGEGRLNEITNKNKNISIVYYNYTIVSGFDRFTFLFFKKNLGMPLCQNVLGTSIFLALNMGYKKIYLFGADHSWIQNLRVNENNELYMNHVHFYSNESKPVITKIYRSQFSSEMMPLSEYFLACFKTFHVYYILERYSRYLKARIYNASGMSYIDAFERKNP